MTMRTLEKDAKITSSMMTVNLVRVRTSDIPVVHLADRLVEFCHHVANVIVVEHSFRGYLWWRGARAARDLWVQV
jgi:hypothetical protein